ncbi:hypothetical protein ACHAPT_012126 [Fusarium lateritium]
MTAPLQDVTAVVTPSDQDIVFHVNSSGVISYWSSRSADETEGEQYNTDNLKINGSPISVNPKLPILAAVAYRRPHSEVDEVRVYYVDEKTLTIREIRRNGRSNAKWEVGQVFNQQQYQIAPNSGLTANVVSTCNNGLQLKVYYQRDVDKLNVVYNVLTQAGENWSTRYDVTN